VAAELPLDPKRDQLLDTHDLRELLGCSRNTVTRLIQTGRLRSIKLGRAVRFHPDDVRACIEELRK
jgi:excisionase family DNA binding protein